MDIGEKIATTLMMGFLGCVAVVVYQVMDNLEISFIEKCVKAGASVDRCYEVVVSEKGEKQ